MITSYCCHVRSTAIRSWWLQCQMMEQRVVPDVAGQAMSCHVIRTTDIYLCVSFVVNIAVGEVRLS